MADQFARTKLIIGSTGVEALAAARVCVFGLGGVGSYVVEALARAGIGAIDVVDNDVVDETNINRQLIATWDTVGRAKVDIAAERIASINPFCSVATHRCFYLPSTRRQFDFSSYDYIVDAVDTVSAKLDLAQAAFRAQVPCISCMGTGNKIDPTQFEVADIFQTSVDGLARVMRKELRKRGVPALKCVYSKEPSVEPVSLEAGEQMETRGVHETPIPGSMPYVPGVAGLITAGEVVKDLIRMSKVG